MDKEETNSNRPRRYYGSAGDGRRPFQKRVYVNDGTGGNAANDESYRGRAYDSRPSGRGFRRGGDGSFSRGRGGYGESRDYGRSGGRYSRDDGYYERDGGNYGRDRRDYARDNRNYGRERGNYGRDGGGYYRERRDYGDFDGGYARYGRGRYGDDRRYRSHDNSKGGGSWDDRQAFRGNAGGRGGYRGRTGGEYERYGGRRREYVRENYPDAKKIPPKRIRYEEEKYDPDALIRLNKFLSNAGISSRRDADKYIQAGVVTVNGETVTELGVKVKRSDDVRFHGERISPEKKVYVLLNKPKNCVTTNDDPENRRTVMDIVSDACRERIYPVGRLDRNTTGVLLLTNDGELAAKLTHPNSDKKKIYHVFLDRDAKEEDLRRIVEGVTLEDGEVRADAAEYASEDDKTQVGIEIHSGKNRVVRRIFEALGYDVVKLDRVYFAGLTKKNLRRGAWRFLTQQEVNMLKMGAFE